MAKHPFRPTITGEMEYGRHQPENAGGTNRNLAEVLWEEQGSYGPPEKPESRAWVVAMVVPSSGVGWVDMHWHARNEIVPAQSRRVLADWSGQNRAAVLRQVIPLADDWFRYCEEQAERERAVRALAPPKTPSPGMTAGARLAAHHAPAPPPGERLQSGLLVDVLGLGADPYDADELERILSSL